MVKISFFATFTPWQMIKVQDFIENLKVIMYCIMAFKKRFRTKFDLLSTF